MDASGVSHNSRNAYVGSETVDTSSVDHTFSNPVRNLIVTASGNVKVDFFDGSNQTIPVVVAASDYTLFIKDGKGAVITKVYKTGTTATVLCGLF